MMEVLSEHPREDGRNLALAEIHINAMLRGKKERAKVPDVILHLPCGCSRERCWEGQSEAWHLVKCGQQITHRECKRVVRG